MATVVTVETVFLPCCQSVPSQNEVERLKPLRWNMLNLSDFLEDLMDLAQVINQRHISRTDIFNVLLLILKHVQRGARLG